MLNYHEHVNPILIDLSEKQTVQYRQKGNKIEYFLLILFAESRITQRKHEKICKNAWCCKTSSLTLRLVKKITLVLN